MIEAEQKIKNLLRYTAQQGASDLHLNVGRYPTVRIDGKLIPVSQDSILTPEIVSEMCKIVMDEDNQKKLELEGNVDFSYNFEGKVRYRVDIFMQQGFMAGAFRLIPREIRTLAELNVPEILYEFTHFSQGLMLIVGPVGQGKSTTLAALINEINHTQDKNIITIEDPIEYIYDQDRCIISQREVFDDCRTFQGALKAVFREDANVVLIGEMRDLETISTAMTAAETGHLIFGTLHTNDAAQTIDRIVDVFPSHQQNQIRSQLANVLLGVFSQRLVPRVDGGRVPACELMIKNHAIENLIRENKSYQIDNVIETSMDQGMISMDKYLAELVRKGLVSFENAAVYSKDPRNFESMVRG